MTLVIPRILHQVWLGLNPLPDEFAAYGETWRAHHPDWRFELWTEDHLPDDLRLLEVRDRLRVPAERADILRLEVLWRYGGVYLDTDFECKKSLDPLLDDVEFFTAYLKPGRVNNAIIGATTQHPILDRALRELRPEPTYGYDKEAQDRSFSTASSRTTRRSRSSSRSSSIRRRQASESGPSPFIMQLAAGRTTKAFAKPPLGRGRGSRALCWEQREHADAERELEADLEEVAG